MFQQKWKNNSKSNRSTYASWNGMIRRCYNPNFPGYKDYGGRGIIVCDRWRESYDAFVEDMGHSSKGMSIERQDVNGNYEPSNCVWLPKADQIKNRRRSVRITADGVTRTLDEWSKETGIPYNVLWHRFRKGMPLIDLFKTGSLVNPPKHGTVSAYVSLKCRCEKCREANSVYARSRRLKDPELHARLRREKYRAKRLGLEYDL